VIKFFTNLFKLFLNSFFLSFLFLFYTCQTSFYYEILRFLFTVVIICSIHKEYIIYTVCENLHFPCGVQIELTLRFTYIYIYYMYHMSLILFILYIKIEPFFFYYNSWIVLYIYFFFCFLLVIEIFYFSWEKKGKKCWSILCILYLIHNLWFSLQFILKKFFFLLWEKLFINIEEEYNSILYSFICLNKKKKLVCPFSVQFKVYFLNLFLFLLYTHFIIKIY
jgi:hypothetical protein